MSFFGFGKKKKILVVEDEPYIAQGLEARLQLEGYDVITAGDGKEGVSQARSERPDLVIMDLMMPKVNGFDACKMLKADDKTKKIPIIVLTAMKTLGNTDDAFTSGADAFLAKPFKNERLLEKIQKLIDPYKELK